MAMRHKIWFPRRGTRHAEVNFSNQNASTMFKNIQKCSTNVQRLPKNTQRGTYEPFIFITSIAAVVSFYFAGFLNLDIFFYFVKVFPALIIGSLIGVKIYSFIDEDLFQKVILGLIFFAGLVLLF